MLRFPNPGSTIPNFVAVYTAAFRALNNHVVDLDDLVRAVVDANLATSSGYVGDEAVNRSTREDRSRDPLYNQMKMYAELFRTMGWLQPTAASSLKYSFTLLGEQLVAAGQEYWPLFKHCVLGIAYPTRVLMVMGGSNLRPFAFILRTMQASGGYLSRDEMIIGPLSAVTDRDAMAASDVVAKVTAARTSVAAMDAALTAVSQNRSIQINTLHNYTRWPIAVLRDAGWVEPVQARLKDGRKYRAFALTESGRETATRRHHRTDRGACPLRCEPPTSLDMQRPGRACNTLRLSCARARLRALLAYPATLVLRAPLGIVTAKVDDSSRSCACIRRNCPQRCDLPDVGLWCSSLDGCDRDAGQSVSGAGVHGYAGNMRAPFRAIATVLILPRAVRPATTGYRSEFGGGISCGIRLSVYRGTKASAWVMQ
jgi:hypothetical protein